MKKALTVLGGVLTIASMFLAFVKAGEISVTGMDIPNNVAYVYIGVGAIIAVLGFLEKLNIVTLILGLGVAGMGIKYYMDASSSFTSAGIGIWVMIGGGILAVIGSAMGMMRKTA